MSISEGFDGTVKFFFLRGNEAVLSIGSSSDRFGYG